MYGASFVINDNYSAAVSVTVFFLRFLNHNLFQSMPEAPLSFCTNSATRFRTCCTCVESENKQGTGAFSGACYKSKLPKPKYKQQNWRNVNLQDADGESPLHKAARFGDAKTASFYGGYRKDGESCFFLVVWSLFFICFFAPKRDGY